MVMLNMSSPRSQVLYPLLGALAGRVSAGNDEVRVRGFNLLCQALLHKLADLEQVPLQSKSGHRLSCSKPF